MPICNIQRYIRTFGQIILPRWLKVLSLASNSVVVAIKLVFAGQIRSFDIEHSSLKSFGAVVEHSSIRSFAFRLSIDYLP